MAAPSDKPAGSDPSMEDILASIRRILADGDEGAEAHAEPEQTVLITPPPAPVEEAEPAPVAAEPAPAELASEDVFVLDQTMLIEEPAPMTNETETETVHAAHEPAAEPAAPEFSHLDAGAAPAAPEPLLGAGAAAATSASLGALVRVVNQRQTQIYRNGPTLEDMVREEIRPVVKAWLDENLAPMVERLVRAEIERVTNLK